MNTNDRTIEHFGRVLGRGLRVPEILQSDAAMAIVAFEDPDLGAVHVASLGLAVQSVNALHPTEFVCSVRPDQREAARYLVETALDMAARGGRLTLDSVMDNGTPLLTGTDVCGMLLAPGVWFDELDLLESSSGEVALHVITLLPLTSADVRFLDSHPADEFYERVNATDVDLLDITRRGLV